MLDREKLNKIFSTVSSASGKDAVFVEKDYYQTLMLQEIARISDKLVFKGGTSLSKCYNLIERFSEDIDLSATRKLTEGERRNIYHGILDAATFLSLTFTNELNTKSKRMYNRFVFEYDSSVIDSKLPLILETNYDVPVYPVETIEVPNFVSSFFLSKSLPVPEEFGLFPLEMKVQKPIRTLVDKLFALCDYYLKGEQMGHSRHLYDVYALCHVIPIDSELLNLFSQVRKERAHSKMNPSAQSGIDFQEVFKKVIVDEIYRKDYERVTRNLLYEDVEYKNIQDTLEEILKKLTDC